jgi:zinc transport system ATP-binding protein
MALIACRNVSFAYEGAAVIESLSFEVNAGDCLCIVGENGAGKSTLVRGLLGLLPCSSGSIEFGEGLKAAEIGYLPQQTPAQKDFPASAFEVALSGRLARLGMRPFFSRSDRTQALACMEKMGVADLRNRCYRELSGGQQQRVLLARALCAAERVLLLDEPAAGLDPVATRELYSLIEEMRESGFTIVMVSHDIGAAVRLASCILHLQKLPGEPFFGPVSRYLLTESGKSFSGGSNRG